MPVEVKLSVEEAGKKLREIAEMTAAHSQNWDNFEQICTSILKKSYQAGLGSAQKKE